MKQTFLNSLFQDPVAGKPSYPESTFNDFTAQIFGTERAKMSHPWAPTDGLIFVDEEEIAKMNQKKFLVFDVESIGLYGEGFAVGWVVIDTDGKEHESGLYACDQNRVGSAYLSDEKESKADWAWVETNIPDMDLTHPFKEDLYVAFFEVLHRWLPTKLNVTHPKVSSIWADWIYPVEVSFLLHIFETFKWREYKSRKSVLSNHRVESLLPAPLHEIATICLAADINPNDFPRVPDELSQHNPLNDARHSARLLVKALAKLREQRQLATETLIRG